MKHLILLCLPFLLLLGCSNAQNNPRTLSLTPGQESPAATIEQVAWIQGNWTGEAFGGTIEEVWNPPSAGSMMGMFKSEKDGAVNFYELMIITEQDNSLLMKLKHFNADLTGWEEKEETVDFPLVKLTPDAAYFDGLTFEKVTEEELHVYVVIGMEDGEKQEMKFVYKRVEK
jgi:hypothetical protein